MKVMKASTFSQKPTQAGLGYLQPVVELLKSLHAPTSKGRSTSTRRIGLTRDLLAGYSLFLCLCKSATLTACGRCEAGELGRQAHYLRRNTLVLPVFESRVLGVWSIAPPRTLRPSGRQIAFRSPCINRFQFVTFSAFCNSRGIDSTPRLVSGSKLACLGRKVVLQ